MTKQSKKQVTVSLDAKTLGQIAAAHRTLSSVGAALEVGHDVPVPNSVAARIRTRRR